MPVVRLTARYCETTTANGFRLELRDARVEGLELRVSPAGSKSWALRYRRQSDRRKRTYTLGRYPDMGLEEAREAAREARREIAKGGDPAAGKVATKTAPTFRQVAIDWQENYAEANRSWRVRKDDQSVLSRYILPAIGDLKANTLSRRELSQMLNGVKVATDGRKGHTKGTDDPRRMTHRANKVFEVVRAIIRWAVGEGILTVDATLGMKRPIKKEPARERTLSSAEVRRLWLALDNGALVRPTKFRAGALPMTLATALTMKLSLATGQRIGEVSGIAISELDLNEVAPTWTIPGTRTKNGEAHRVPLSALAVKIIAQARGLAGPDARWLFPSPKGNSPIDAHAATRALSRARPYIDVTNFRVHDLRRTAATKMEELGVLPHVISHVLNHLSVSKGTITSKVYARHTYDREKREALNAWGRQLAEIIACLEATNVVQFCAPAT
jgi:integrase